MKTFLLIVGSLILLVAGFIVWRLIATVRGSHKRTLKLLARLAPVTEALEEGRAPDPGEIERAAATPETRGLLLDVLREQNRLDLFPEGYLTQEALAEADLASWLCHPNELGCPPDEIELMGVITRDSDASSDKVDWYVFQYRTHAPHWAAGDGWMAGVSGPYAVGSEVASGAVGTFSTFEAFDASQLQEYVDFCCDMLRRKGIAI
jgi:hypothetical protein